MYQYLSQVYGTQWESHMGISNIAKVVGSEHTSSEAIKSPSQGVFANASKSNNIFQAQEQDQNQIIEVPSSWCFEFPKTTTQYHHSPTPTATMLICQASGDNFTNTTTTKQDPPSSQFTNSLYSVAESFLSSSGDSHHSSSEKHSKFPSYSEKHVINSYGHFPQEHDKLLRDDAATDERPSLEISFQRNQPEKQAPRHCGVPCVTSSNFASRRGKRRIRWTKDLHEPFMMIVNRLGGPEKAKPKAILEMMKSDLLSISHVKSHLQKCRTTIHMHKALQDRSEEGHRKDGVTELQVKIHMQIEESRQLQLEVRRSICQQLEMQRNLQRLIEDQSKQLKEMLDQQKERTNTGENSLIQNWK